MKFFSCALLIVSFLTSGELLAYSVRQQVSKYHDNQGVTRDRVKFDLGMDYKRNNSTLSASGFTVAVSRDFYNIENTEEDYNQEVYGGESSRVEDTIAVSASQTWSKLTDTRLIMQTISDRTVKSQTYGIGASRWIWHETIQGSLDVSRTLVERPVFEILGEDSDIVSPPANQESTGITAGIRHLATTTTITDYKVTHVESNDRPPSNTYFAGIKQFIPWLSSAVHFSVARAFNRGRVTTRSSYGEVDSWVAETAYLQSLWRGAKAKASYRYYKEEETTRASKEEYVRGSDLVGLNFAQDVPKGTVDSLNQTLTIELGGSRYLTNEIDDEGTKIAANIYEMRLMTKF